MSKWKKERFKKLAGKRGFFSFAKHALFALCAVFISASAWAACANNEIDVLNDGSQCETAHFTLTTTSTNSFQFKMSAAGTFYVDCGNGGTLSGTGASGKIITRTDTSVVAYACSWSSNAVQTVRFGGTATDYYSQYITYLMGPSAPAAIKFNPSGNNSDANAQKISAISGDLGKIFGSVQSGRAPRFYDTFLGSTNLTSIPSTLFASIDTSRATDTSYMFYNTFHSCSNLTSIPSELFASVDTSLSTDATEMFHGTFKGTAITSIPSELFSTIYTGSTTNTKSMFSSIFQACTSLTSVPADLFSKITTAGQLMFSYVFYQCPNISGYIPPSTFAGLIANKSPTASDMWTGTFDGTQLVTSCPTGTKEYTTGYKSTWNNRVSCQPCIDVSGNGSQCETAHFTLTTTTLNASDSFSFATGAVGTFYVDCGENGVLSGTGVSGKTITRTNTNGAVYTCTYSGGIAEPKTIRFGGRATNYSPNANTTASMALSFWVGASDAEKDANAAKIDSVSGDLSLIFPYIDDNAASGAQPRFYSLFRGATNLDNLPNTLFSHYTKGSEKMFYFAFNGCTSFTALDPDLFASFTTGANYMFSGAFRSCTGLTTVPSGLFRNFTTGGTNMFDATFRGCTGLTSVQSGLFASFTTGVAGMFASTFYGCTYLTSIPADLFASSVTGANTMFSSTFQGCTRLASVGDKQYVPASFISNVTSGTNVVQNMFNSTALAGTCPSGTTNVTPSKFSNAGKPWCEKNSAFSLTTVADTTSFQFSLSAKGTFYVDCGDGGTLTSGSATNYPVSGTTVNRTYGTDNVTYTCTWGSAGAHTIKFDGTATDYNTNTSTAAISFYAGSNHTNKRANAVKIGSVSGDLSAMFPYMSNNSQDGTQPHFYDSFRSATNLVDLPNTLFENYTTGTTTMFEGTFSGCTGLQSIPSGLFSSLTTGAAAMFHNTFSGCAGLQSIPSGLFSSLTTGANNMFAGTFGYCTGLQSIPSGLFSSFTTGAGDMFNSTFVGCTGLQSIPEGLFRTITTGGAFMFASTFSYCDHITGYIPPSTFAGLIANGSPTANYMWHDTFNGTQLVSSCPSGTIEYETGYKGSNSINYEKWENYVACEPCPTGYTNSLAGATSNTQCYKTCQANIPHATSTGIYYPNDNTCAATACATGYNLNNGACTGKNYNCSAGSYLNANTAMCVTCTEGNYCAGGNFTFNGMNQGLTQCPSGYSNSATGASANTQCYKACTTANITGASAVSGNDYYGNGLDTCSATTCNTGYHVLSVETAGTSFSLNDQIGDSYVTSHAIQDLNGNLSGNSGFYEYITQNGEMVVEYDSGDKIHGVFQCSSQGGTGVHEDPSNATVMSILPNNVGGNCWCKVDGVIPANGSNMQNIGASWVMGYPLSNEEECSYACQDVCFDAFAQDYAREKIFDAVQQNPDLNTIISDNNYLNSVAIQDLNGNFYGDSDFYGYITRNGEMVAEYDSGDKIHGVFQCSSQGGNAALVHGPEDAAIMSFLPDNTGGNCWCKVDGFIPSGSSSMQNVGGAWMLGVDLVDGFGGDPDICSQACQDVCTDVFAQDYAREKLFDAVSSPSATSTLSSCELNVDTCNAGYYLPANTDNCAQCPINSSCPGGTYTFSPTVIQGIQSCPADSFAPTGSAVCYPHIMHVGNDVIYLKSTKQTTPSLNFKIGNDIFYANMTQTRTKMSKDSSHYFRVQWGNNDYYACDETTCPQ